MLARPVHGASDGVPGALVGVVVAVLFAPGLLGTIVSLIALVAGPLAWIAVGVSAAVLAAASVLVALRDDAWVVVDPAP